MLLILHIISGSICLLTGTANMIARKGGGRHKTIGRIFVISMSITSLTALTIAIEKGLIFLLLTSGFSLYLTISGYLHIRNKTGTMPIKYVSYAMIAFGLFLLAFGVNMLVRGNFFGLVSIVFSIIGLLMALTDLRFPANDYMTSKRRHLQRMSGAYIASTTAFLVVNIKSAGALNGVVLWLLPTIIITPFIVKWSRQQQKA